MKVNIEVNSNPLQQADKLIDASIKSAAKLENQSKASGRQIETAGKQYVEASQGVKKNTDSLSMNAKQSKDTSRQHESLASAIRKARDGFNEQKKSVDGASKSLKDLVLNADTAKKAMETIGAGLLAKKMADLGAAAVKVGMDFDKQMSGVQAISGATKDQFQAMRKEAIYWGAASTKSSSEVAEGMMNLAQAGFSVKGIMGAIPGVINASAASGADMAIASSVMSDALNAFGLNASKATHIADVLAMSANKTNADITDLGYTFKYAAPVAHTLGLSLEDVSAAAGLMANAGIRGETAGTTLRSAMLSLVSPTNKAAAELDDLKVKITDSHKQMLPFGTIVGELQTGMEGMTKAQKAAAISTIFGKETTSGMLAVISAGPKKYEDLTKALQNSDGASAKAAHTIQDNFAGAVEQLDGTLESMAINVSDVLTPAIREMTNILSAAGNVFNGLSDSGKRTAVEIGLIATVGAPTVFFFSKVYKGIKLIKDFMKTAGPSFSNYRSEMAKTGASALEMASQVKKANEIMESSSGNVVAPSTNSAKGAKSYSQLMKEANNKKVTGSTGKVITAVEEVEQSAAKSGVLSKLGKVGKGVAKGVGKGALKSVPYVGTLLSATDLLNINDNNSGQKIGNFSGSLIGGAIGGGLGSFLGPAGTMAGAAIGSVGGEMLGGWLGPKIQKSFSSSLTGVEKFGKGVSKTTAQAYNDFKQLNDKATSQLEYLSISGDKLSKSASNSLSKNFNDMAKNVEDDLSKSAKNTKGNLQKLVTAGVLNADDMKGILVTHNRVLASEKSDIEKTNKKIQAANKNMYIESKQITSKYESEINAIKSKAKKKGIALTEEEMNKIKSLEQRAAEERRNVQTKYKNQIEKLQQQQNKNVITALSGSAREQKLILGKLRDDSEKISASQAADIVKQSVKARNGAVSEANKKYKQVMDAADQEYYVTGSISKSQYDEIKKNATKQRDDAVSLANDMNNKVVAAAKQQAKGHLNEIDWETGQSLSKWNQFEVSLSKVVNWISGGINNVLKFMHIPTIPMWNPAGTTGANATTPSSSSATSSRGINVSGTGAMATYAAGTSYHPGGKSLVGEEGPELAYIPYKGATLVGQNGAEVVDLPKGARVLPHSQTKLVLNGGLSGTMPGYASGTLGAIQDFTSWFLHPVQQIEKWFSNFLPMKNDLGNSPGLGTGILNYAKDGIGNYVKSAVSDFVGSGGQAAGSKQVQAWLLEAIGATGVSPSYLPALSQIAMHESGGNPRAINLWDSNAKAGHPSKGLMQTIDSTFKAYALPGHNDIWNPVDNAIASIRYSISRYGSIDNVPGIKSLASGGKYKGYKMGGRKFGNDRVLVGEDGPELVDLPDGSNVHNTNKTQDILKQTKGNITINLSPVFNINIGDSNGSLESKVQQVLNKGIEELMKDLRAMFDPGVAM